MTLGEKIRAARLEKHMTQSEIAEDKITRNMLSAIESGKSLPSLETLFHISEKLEIPLSYLFGDDEDIAAYKKNRILPKIRAGNFTYRIEAMVQFILSNRFLSLTHVVNHRQQYIIGLLI